MRALVSDSCREKGKVNNPRWPSSPRGSSINTRTLYSLILAAVAAAAGVATVKQAS